MCKTYLFILSALIYVGSAYSSPGGKALEKFQASFVKEVQREYGFHPLGVGASFPVKINWVDLRFSADCYASVEEGRRLIVPLVHKFIQRMNEDRELIKYLSNSPASIANVALTVRFKDGPTSPLQSIMIIGSKNLIVYNKYDEFRKRLLDLHEESFDEAVRLVQQCTGSSSETHK